jgi:hypothetical protein
MEMEINGIVFSVYQVRGQWKVVHGVRAFGRVGRSIVVNVASEADGIAYAENYGRAA